MPRKYASPPTGPSPRLVLFVAYPDVGLLDLTGPQTAFWIADRILRSQGQRGYQLEIVSEHGGLVQASEGLQIATQPIAGRDIAAVDTLVVPGSPHIVQVLERSAQLVGWLRSVAPSVRRVASVCTGTFLLAQAGLLTSKRVATHWAMCDALKERFPSIDVDMDAIFVQQGAVWTSAGVSTGLDLALALVQADCGHSVAMEAAKELVVFLKRPGGQSQYSEPLQSQAQEGRLFETLNAWIKKNIYRDDLSVSLLAGRMRMSDRHFARVYKEATGRTPARSVELFRVEAAQRLLEASAKSLDQVARACGFGTAERLRVSFRRHMGVSPREYRDRFGAGRRA